MKFQRARVKLGQWDIHALQCTCINDIYIASTIHEDISEPEIATSCFNQGINNQSMSPWVGNVGGDLT